LLCEDSTALSGLLHYFCNKRRNNAIRKKMHILSLTGRFLQRKNHGDNGVRKKVRLLSIIEWFL
jgi:hypothetical protein